MTLDSNDEDLFPDAELATTGLTGAVADLDDEETSTWYTADDPDSSNDVSARWGMADPSAALSGTQNLYVYVRHTGNGTDDVSFTVELYEAGSSVETVISSTVASSNTSGSEFSGTWDASSVSNGADVEFRFSATNTGGMPGTRDVGEIAYVTWGAGLDVFATVTTQAATSVTSSGATLNGEVDWTGTSVEVWFEWDEDTQYEVASREHSSAALSTSDEDSDPRGMAWNDTGSKLYVAGNATDAIYEYDCSTNYDVTTAGSSPSAQLVSNEDSTVEGTAWNDTGSKLYMVGNATNAIYEYDCSTNYDVTTAGSSPSTLGVGNENVSPNGMAWNDTGSKLYMVGQSPPASIYEYDCSTNFDITSATHSATLDISSENGIPEAVFWNGTGSKLYMAGDESPPSVYQYACSTNYDITSTTHEATIDISADNTVAGATWDSDGGTLYIVDDFREEIREWVPTLANQTTKQTINTTGVQSFNDTISSLSGSTSYDFRAHADVDSGTVTDQGDILDFATEAGTTAGSVLKTTSGVIDTSSGVQQTQ